jgi:hypothetical protein
MAEQDTVPAPPVPPDATGVPSGSYELLVGRLHDAGTQLTAKTRELNDARAELFSAAPLALVETDRIHTETVSAATDVVVLGDVALVGFNPEMPPTAPVRQISEVFKLYRPGRTATGWEFAEVDAADPSFFLHDEGFVTDFTELYTYYEKARLLTLSVAGDRLLMIFGIGDSSADIRVLRWRIARGARPQFIDSFGDADVAVAERFDFPWTELGRDHIRDGREPTLDIAGELTMSLHIDAAGAAVQFRTDDAVTGTTLLLSEPVDDASQALNELKAGYAKVGDLVLVRVMPFREDVERFYVFNRVTRQLVRNDPIGENARVLPGEQGIIFPGGYQLSNGDARTFTTEGAAWSFYARHIAPNGEDVLYTYQDPSTGRYLLCGYNIVTKSMANPIAAGGYGIFDDATVICLREAEEPSRVHTVSVYTSPFCSPDRYVPPVAPDSFFGRIGNPELVAVLGDCFALARDVEHADFNPAVFEAFVARTRKLVDTYAWLDEPDALGIGPLLVSIRKTSGDILDELAAVNAARKAAFDAVAEASTAAHDFVADAEMPVDTTEAFIALLTRGRAEQGRLATLRDMRFVELDAVAALTTDVARAYAALADRALEFLAGPDAFAALGADLDAAQAAAEAATTAGAASEAAERIESAGEQVTVLTDVVSNLDSDDAPTKTAVLESLAGLLARRNAAAAVVTGRLESLRSSEHRGQFTAAIGVLGQRAAAAAMAADDPKAVDQAMASIGAEISALESRFGDVTEFAETLADERDRIYAQLTQRRDAIAAEREARLDRIVRSARRSLATISARASALTSREEFDAFFATDPLVARVRAAVDELRAAGETGRADELTVAFDSARAVARRAATDRAELFADDGTVRIGSHRFGVNTAPFDLHLAMGDDGLELRLGGTDLAMAVPAGTFDGLEDAVTQVYPTETPTMSRALHLAFECWHAAVPADPAAVRAHAQAQLGDGYELGVHDADAARILLALDGLLEHPTVRFDGAHRGVAASWFLAQPEESRAGLADQLRSLRALEASASGTGSGTVPGAGADRGTGTGPAGGRPSAGSGSVASLFARRVGGALAELAEEAGVPLDVSQAVTYLVECADDLQVTAPAAQLAGAFTGWARTARLGDVSRFGFATLTRYLCDWSAEHAPGTPVARCTEAALLLASPEGTVTASEGVEPRIRVDGLLSLHPTIQQGALVIDVDEAHGAYVTYRRDQLPRFTAAATTRRSYLDAQRRELALDELRPGQIPNFVRNTLISDVYLPLLGDNFAKQLGMTGAAQGLLMLISPPGYGKTTLVEYVSNLLGFALVKVNGPALGPEVTSLDPAAAPDAAASAELVKLNRAFAMGTNVMLYIDDIQHTSAELLSRFIPLCDATRRIDGVHDGEAATFKLAGKRFVTVMAGNPYTTSGESFQLPDMLTNRADVYNLGDVISGHGDAFASSYLEVAAGSNPTLEPVVAVPGDLDVFVESLRTGVLAEADLSRAFTGTEAGAVQATLGHLSRVRDQLLSVNASYIASASVDDTMRGEPPFLLQGSYRNMAKVAQRVVPRMDDREVDALVLDHYRSEAQTLAGRAAWNIARLEALLHPSVEATAAVDDLRARWQADRDLANPVTQVTASLAGIEDALRGRPQGG